MDLSIMKILLISITTLLFGCSSGAPYKAATPQKTAQGNMEDLELKVAARSKCHEQLNHINMLEKANKSPHADKTVNNRRIESLRTMYNYMCK